MLAFTASSSRAGDLHSWARHQAALSCEDTALCADKAVAEAVRVGGRGVVPVQPAGSIVRVFVLVPRESLPEFGNGLRRVALRSLTSWAVDGGSDTARLAAVRADIEAFGPFAEAMPTLASLLQAEADDAFHSFYGELPKPYAIVSIGTNPPGSGLAAALENAAQFEWPYDELWALRAQVLPRDTESLRPIVSASASDRLKSWRLPHPIDCPTAGVIRLRVDSPSFSYLRNSLDARYTAHSGVWCPATFPDRNQRGADQYWRGRQYSVESLEDIARMEKIISSHGSVVERTEASGDTAAVRFRQELIFRLETELKEYSEFVAGRQRLRRLAQEGLKRFRSEEERLTRASVRYLAVLNVRETRR